MFEEFMEYVEWGTSFGSHDAAIAVFVDGEIVFSSDAERWSKKKNDNTIPDNLISYCEEHWGIPMKVYYYENPYLKATRRFYAGQKPFFKKPNFKYPLHYTNHHYSHACYGYYTSPFDECVVLVIDAIGEWDTLSVWHAKKDKLKRKSFKWKYPKSLGLFYSAMTQAAGWKPNEEEYIMMGAAAVRENMESCEDLYFNVKDKFESGYNFHTGVKFESYWNQYDIAKVAQVTYEDHFSEILNYASNIHGNIVLVGGCALNVSANRHLYTFDNVYVPPNPGDGGSAIGCVLARKKQHIPYSPFLGYNIKGRYPTKQIIEELCINKVVGIAKGKAEFGPRALGNRSIFADPRVKNIKDILNQIKGRESFRPFGAMILKEDVDKYFIDSNIPSPYMNCVYSARKITIDMYPGLVHMDHTTRLQIVDKSQPHLVRLLKEWKKQTECPLIINTSLNIKGQPIVNDENDVKLFQQKYKLKVL